jgi:hypothetical protein
MGRVGADGETGDFKGLMLSNSGPVFLGSWGFFFGQGADRVSARPAKAGGRPAGTCHDAHGGRGRVMTKREATLNERTRMYSRHTQRSAVPLRSS